MNRVVKIDLTNKEVSQYKVKNNVIGGKVMAVNIFKDIVPVDAKPFDINNTIVISTSPFISISAPFNRYHVSFISPLTNLFTTSNYGGIFGLVLKQLGYDALIITGISKHPIWIEVNEDGIYFHDASCYWGLTTSKTKEKINSNVHLIIGPAGENRVKYANVISNQKSYDKYGVGALFGTKNLKAIVVNGKSKALNLNPCFNCPYQCGKVFPIKDIILKEKEFVYLNKLSQNEEKLIKWKKLADDMGLDMIHLIELYLSISKDLDIETLIKQVVYDKVEYNIKNRMKKLNIEKEIASFLGLCSYVLKYETVEPYIRLFNDKMGLNLTKEDFENIVMASYHLEQDYNKKRKIEERIR